MISCVLWWRHGDGWCWVLGVQPTSSLTHQTTRVHSVSCNGQLHHWMTSWEAGAGWLITMGASTSYHEDIHNYKLLSINSFETFENYHQSWTNVETNSSRSDMLRNGIWWLGRVEFLPESFMPESFKHLICSIRVSTVACRMALHDMPNPHLVDQENCLAREITSQTGDTHRVSRRFPSRSYRLQLLRIKNAVYIIYYIETKTSAMAPPTCNESKCAAFMLYMGIGLGEKQSCKTWQKWANAAQNKWTSFPNIRRHEMFFLNDWKHW